MVYVSVMACFGAFLNTENLMYFDLFQSFAKG
jgi:hypothetical protein